MIPLCVPNLPASPVTLVATAGDIRGLDESLERYAIKTIHVTDNHNLEPCISNHTDILMNHLGGIDILLSKEQMFLGKELIKSGFKTLYADCEIMSPYPNDVPLNTARLNRFLICNPKTAAKEIQEYAAINALEILPVKQGYTKCSICIINENAIITEDEGIKRVCEQKGIDVLLISKGSIKLKSKTYGFFGGCTGLLDKNKLGICGNIEKHSDYKNIAGFLEKHSTEPVSLTDGDLTDIGGIIPLMQKNDIGNA